MKSVVPELALARTAARSEHGLVVHKDVAVAARTYHAVRRRASSRLVESQARYRVGVISNGRSHRNRQASESPEAAATRIAPDVLARAPATLPELSRALLECADAGVELLIVDGGDGTVRDVISCAASLFPDGLPRMAVVPSGKTNALAIDLGIPADWTVREAVEAGRAGSVKLRAPIDILRPGSELPDLRGFLFGTGAFVRATGLAQRTHKAGAFRGVAVGLSLGWGVAQTLFGGRGNVWRAGETVGIAAAGEPLTQRDFYMLFGSTLERLPLGVKPFGAVREGLKLLAIDAPPRAMARAVGPLLRGSEAPWLERAGYHRLDTEAVRLSIESGFVLDGELYAGGEFTVRRGAPIQFVVP